MCHIILYIKGFVCVNVVVFLFRLFERPPYMAISRQPTNQIICTKKSKNSLDRVKIDSDYKITVFTSCSKFLLWLGKITYMYSKGQIKL